MLVKYDQVHVGKMKFETWNHSQYFKHHIFVWNRPYVQYVKSIRNMKQSTFQRIKKKKTRNLKMVSVEIMTRPPKIQQCFAPIFQTEFQVFLMLMFLTDINFVELFWVQPIEASLTIIQINDVQFFFFFFCIVFVYWLFLCLFVRLS